jgi:hypothetical protein
MSERDRRIADNEQRFRVFNDEVEQVGAQLHSRARFSCECGNDRCTTAIELDADEYARLRADATWFAVLPGHNRPDVERVIERHDAYLIVEKTGEGAERVR